MTDETTRQAGDDDRNYILVCKMGGLGSMPSAGLTWPPCVSMHHFGHCSKVSFMLSPDIVCVCFTHPPNEVEHNQDSVI